jgi:UDP-N-acetylglucosamine 2-epimerase (non-hydrolysing)
VIHVFLGTKAQYIKTAPLLRRLDAEAVPYRLIDSGQHAHLSVGLRDELGVRAPDHALAAGRDITRIPQAFGWALRLAWRLVDRRRLRHEIFGGRGGICVVHGDTPSTLLSTLMARRAGLAVAHLEAGLRSGRLLHPFPEEAIRLVVMRLASLLFAPDELAAANLHDMGVKGEVVLLPANTVLEALEHDLSSGGPPEPGVVVVTLHRVENLHRRERLERLVATVERIARDLPVRFVRHGPTVDTLRRFGFDRRLAAAGVELTDLTGHARFVAMLRDAPFVITDGGSIQEECALLGTPTLLWRAATERPDGLGRNVVLSGYDAEVVGRFLTDPEQYRTPAAAVDATPSAVVLDHLRPWTRGREPAR